MSEEELRAALGDLGFGGAARAAAAEMVGAHASQQAGVSLQDFLGFVRKAKPLLITWPFLDLNPNCLLKLCQRMFDAVHNVASGALLMSGCAPSSCHGMMLTTSLSTLCRGFPE